MSGEELRRVSKLFLGNFVTVWIPPKGILYFFEKEIGRAPTIEVGGWT